MCSVDLPYNLENVCLQVQPDYNLYAVGSRSHVSFVDGRLGNQAIGSIRSKDRDCGMLKLCLHLVRIQHHNDDMLLRQSGYYDDTSQ